MRYQKLIIVAIAAITATSLISFNFKDEKPATPATQMVADWERAKAFTLEYVNAATDEA